MFKAYNKIEQMLKDKFGREKKLHNRNRALLPTLVKTTLALHNVPAKESQQRAHIV